MFLQESFVFATIAIVHCVLFYLQLARARARANAPASRVLAIQQPLSIVMWSPFNSLSIVVQSPFRIVLVSDPQPHFSLPPPPPSTNLLPWTADEKVTTSSPGPDQSAARYVWRVLFTHPCLGKWRRKMGGMVKCRSRGIILAPSCSQSEKKNNCLAPAVQVVGHPVLSEDEQGVQVSP